MRLAPLFHDHAVLQRDVPIPVWGTATPESAVTVRLAGMVAQVAAGADGAWLVRLPPLPAGGPHILVASADGGEARVDDVLIGEVWVCSGQSNMAWTLAQTGQPAAADDDELARVRVLTVSAQPRPGRQIAIDGRWARADALALADFSAVGGWFGRALHRALGVPIGLIANAYGGSRVQAWMSREALMGHPAGVDEVRGYESFAFRPARPGEPPTKLEWEQGMRRLDTGNAGFAAGWAEPACDEAGWIAMPVPSRWQDHGHAASGVWWYRRSCAVPAAWLGADLVLALGAIDKHDDTYVNGVRVGGLSWEGGPNTWSAPRTYRVPARLVGRDGALTIAVRVRSHLFHGGMIGPARAMSLARADDPSGAVPLAGDWRCRREQDWGVTAGPAAQPAPSDHNAPNALFDCRVAPLLPYAIRGVVWYQGESNAHEAALYRELLPAMIRDWRRAWGQGSFPFLQVQLAAFAAPDEQPTRSAWAELRDAQLAALAEPATGMAVAIDVGDAGDIHPADKRTVGERLARLALAGTYGRDLVPSGPLFTGMTITAEGGLRCRFAHAGGLRTRDGEAPVHVVIAGSDRRFVPAEARIEGETMVAWNPAVPRPVAIRYAWAANPTGCNLVNGEDLPASPFRSDAW